MRFRLDPTSATGISIEPTPARNQSSSFAMKGNDGVGVPAGGAQNQVLQKASATGYDTFWGVAITVSNTSPASPAVNDLWIDTT